MAYFVISQIFSVPESITVTLTHLTEVSDVTQTVAIVLGLMSTVCIIVIGGLLVEYMNDGTIYNKAFNVFCTVTMLLLLIFSILSIFDMIRSGSPNYIFATIFGLTHMTMVFLLTFFAYDSAKTQLSKIQS